MDIPSKVIVGNIYQISISRPKNPLLKMAGVTPLSKEELSERLVQGIAEKGNQIPEKFILKDGFPEAIDAPLELWTDTLLMDFSLLSSSDPHQLAKLKSALSNWGCFQVSTYVSPLIFLF